VAQFIVRAFGYEWKIDEITMLTLDFWQPEQIFVAR
jgi:hypothetical protein